MMGMVLSFKRASLCILTVIIFSSTAFCASEDKCKDSKNEKVKTGTIASVGSYGGGPVAVQGDTSGATPGEEASKISGSIKNITDKKCAAVVTNSSECNTYRLSFQVTASKKTKGESRVLTSSSAQLAPLASKEVPFSCDTKEYNYYVEVTRIK